MHKLFLSFAILVIGLTLIAAPTWADVAPGGVLISRVLVGDNFASDEFIELMNTTARPIEVTGWCVVYTNGAETSKKTIGCLKAPDTSHAVMLPSGGTALFVSAKLIMNVKLADTQYTASFSGGMADDAGHVYLIPNGSGDTTQAIDELDWGLPSSLDGAAPAGDILMRVVLADGSLQDTNNHQADFMFAAADSMTYGQTSYLQPDLCLNLDGVQTEVPPGDDLDESGNCAPPPVDVCLNIDGVQPVPPPGAAVDTAGNCLQDVCPNLEGIQTDVPSDMEFDQTGMCVPSSTVTTPPPPESPGEGGQSDTPSDGEDNGAAGDDNPGGTASDSDSGGSTAPTDLVLSELLPNPKGSDTGNEFIEFYNPSARELNLNAYNLRVSGTSSTATIALPDMTVKAGEYFALYNSVTPFTLVNTTGQVSLVRLSDGQTVSQTDVYTSAADDMAWALIDGEQQWQYTNQLTPNAANKPSLAPAELTAIVGDTAKPCAANQYRNLETNRCRLISVATTPAPCKDGQYRSEETGRCRSIAADANTVTACKPGQERNPDTNRCRQIAAATSSSAPCKAGQERNPETNRCRNTTSMPAADYGVLGAKTKTVSYVWWIVAAVVVGAGAYAVWEWHEEIVTWSGRLLGRLKARK